MRLRNSISKDGHFMKNILFIKKMYRQNLKFKCTWSNSFVGWRHFFGMMRICKCFETFAAYLIGVSQRYMTWYCWHELRFSLVWFVYVTKVENCKNLFIFQYNVDGMYRKVWPGNIPRIEVFSFGTNNGNEWILCNGWIDFQN